MQYTVFSPNIDTNSENNLGISQQAALRLLELNPQWHLLPQARGKKSPLRGSRGHLDATNDPNEVANWPDGCNVALSVGAQSGVIAIDIDGAEGLADLVELESELGELPTTVQDRSPSGGGHYFFVFPPDIELPYALNLTDNIEILSKGHALTIPPSVNYEWINPPWTHEAVELPIKWLEFIRIIAKEKRKGRPDLSNLISNPQRRKGLLIDEKIEVMKGRLLKSVPKKVGSRHRMMLQFCRQLARYYDPAVTPAADVIHWVWEWFDRAKCRASWPEHFEDFKATWSRTKWRRAVLEDAWERAKSDETPAWAKQDFPNKARMHHVIRFILRLGADGKKFFLGCRELGAVMGISYKSANKYLNKLKRLGVLQLNSEKVWNPEVLEGSCRVWRVSYSQLHNNPSLTYVTPKSDICPGCGEVELTGRQRACSEKCTKRIQRRRNSQVALREIDVPVGPPQTKRPSIDEINQLLDDILRSELEASVEVEWGKQGELFLSSATVPQVTSDDEPYEPTEEEIEEQFQHFLDSPEGRKHRERPKEIRPLAKWESAMLTTIGRCGVSATEPDFCDRIAEMHRDRFGDEELSIKELRSFEVTRTEPYYALADQWPSLVDIKRHGRGIQHFASNWKKELRREFLRMDGEPTAEIDFNGSYFLYLAWASGDPDLTDLLESGQCVYVAIDNHVNGTSKTRADYTSEQRQKLKQTVNTNVLTAPEGSRFGKTRWFAGAAQLFPMAIEFVRHRRLVDGVSGSDFTKWLCDQESGLVVEDVMTALVFDHDIPALPFADMLCVSVSRAEEAAEVMMELGESRLGFRPAVSVDRF